VPRGVVPVYGTQKERRCGMNTGKSTVVSVAIASLALIVCTLIVARPLDTFVNARKSITVTGSAKKQIVSDLAVWNGNFSYQDKDMKVAYAGLKEAAAKVKDYLLKQGIAENQIMFSAVSTEVLYEIDPKTQEILAKTGMPIRGELAREISGYILRQTVEVSSKDVQKTAVVSRESTQLINQGVLFQSYPVQFFYTKLNDLKVDMLAEASRDAKARAEKIVTATGGTLGYVRSAKMGVFQITRLNSNEVSDYGINDTSSLEKEITAVVNVEFTIK
jgi:hypothetical protein